MRKILPTIVVLLLGSGCSLETTLCAPCTTVCPDRLTCVAGRCAPTGGRCEPAVDDALDAKVDATALDAPDATAPDASAPDATAADAAGNPPRCEHPQVHAERLWRAGDAAGPPGLGLPGAAIVTLDQRPHLLLHGGAIDNAATDDLWLFDLTAGQWRSVALPDGGRQAYHTLLPVPGTEPLEIWRIGGGLCGVDTGPGTAIRAFALPADGPAEVRPNPTPSGLALNRSYCLFGADVVAGVAYLHGGTVNSGPDHPIGFRVDAVEGRVDALASPSPEGAEPLYRSAVAYDAARGHGYVLGGQGAGLEGAVGRFWRVDVSSGAWTSLDHAALDAPPPAYWGGLVWLPAVDQLLAFGGWDPSRQDAPTVSPQVHLFDLRSGAWQAHDVTDGPAPRMAHVLLALPDGRSAVVFGGTTGIEMGIQPLPDLWRLSVTCEGAP